MPSELIPKDKLVAQIRAYSAEFPTYKSYAKALEDVLRQACKTSAPEALVQSRPKSLSSFAEKCARKYEKYKDAVHEFTDLCGARVIVQTLEQVQAVRKFIEANFKIVEKEDKGLLLQPDEFGYRDMHYIVQLQKDRGIGFSEENEEEIKDRKAEIQVRTWVQHAWADTLHDRMYKAKLKLSPEISRTGALLAAIMEDGDRSFSRLSLEIDGMVANYTEYASKEDVNREVDILRLLLENEPDDLKKMVLSLQISRLLAASGEYGQVAVLLDNDSCKKAQGALSYEKDLYLGCALCKANRNRPYCPDFERGQNLLRGVVGSCGCSDICEVPNLRKQQNMEARAHSYLGWSLARQKDKKDAEVEARIHYQAALACEPGNPYYLADVLGYEIYCTSNRGLAGSMQATIAEAILTCREHALRNTEMPYACFTAGRLNLLLGSCADSETTDQCRRRGYEALGWYARGIHHYLSGAHVVPSEVLESEKEWLLKVNRAVHLPPQYSWSLDLLEVAAHVDGMRRETRTASDLTGRKALDIVKPVLVIAGGAGGMDGDTLERIKPFVSAALERFSGTVISGGTNVGVPGCVGDIAERLQKANRKGFSLVGYVKKKFTEDAPRHHAYEEKKLDRFGPDFSPDHVLQGWRDILRAGQNLEKVLLLGFGGGLLSKAEYQIGAALGADVGVVLGTGGAADELACDPLWGKLSNFFPLPADRSTVRAFVLPAKKIFELIESFDPKALENKILQMAESFHEKYVQGSADRLPPNMRPWKKLGDKFKSANLEQAKYAIEILEAAGFGVREAKDEATVFEFEDGDLSNIENMAELEHGRWNVDRLRNGWRFGKFRDDSKYIHNCIVSWNELPDKTRRYDRDSVKAFPGILAKAGFEIFRLETPNPKDDK